MKTKKLISILIICVMISTIAACGGQGADVPAGPPETGIGNPTGPGPGPATTPDPGVDDTPAGNLSGSAVDLLTKIDEALKATGLQMPMTLPPLEVASDMSQNDVGLSSSDFDRLVVSAASSLAAIGTFAHQIVIIQANDANAAVEVKNLISGSNGYDAQKWVCVWPEKVIVVESSAYVLLAAANADVVDAAIEAFKNEAGTIGSVVTFFEHEGGMEEPGGGGLLIVP